MVFLEIDIQVNMWILHLITDYTALSKADLV